MHDAAIIGGGPAGAALAATLAAHGRRVLLIDPCEPPAPRVESLVPDGARLAQELGLGPALDAAALGEAVAIRSFWRREAEHRAFGAPRPLLLDRARLHAALRREAERRGAETLRARARIVDGAASVGGAALPAHLVIDARGRRARSARQAPPLAALPFHGSVAGVPAPEMRIEALADGWIWACAGPTGLLAGALFTDPGALAGGGAEARAARLRRLLSTAETTRGAAGLRAGRPVAAGLEAAPDPLAAPAVLRIGDAALARDPVAAHGLAHAFRSAAQAAAAVETMLDPAGEADAARAFLRARHAESLAAAIAATGRAYAEQDRRDGPFWRARAAAADSPTPQPPRADGPLILAAPLVRAAALENGRIRWVSALRLPRSGREAAHLGPLSAASVAALLTEPGAPAALTARLAPAVGPEAAAQIVAMLVSEEALAPAERGAAGASEASTAG